MNPQPRSSAQGNRLWFRSLSLPLQTRVFLTRVESQAHSPNGLTALWLGLRGLG